MMTNQMGEDRKIRAYNMQEYIINNMQTDMQRFVEGGPVKTGYENMDVVTSLYPGLYIIGAVSSLGKTTFVHQMAENMAEAGKQVIYFSLEQNTLELLSKSLARIMAKQDAGNGMTSLQIRMHGDNERVSKAVREYGRYACNVTVAECGYRATISDIENFVTTYISERKVKPIVVIDYLQMIQPDSDARLSSREQIDIFVRRLKQLQSDNNLIMIVISSLNRQNYLTQVDYESFKESGGIEYTADVVWGLELQILNDPLFDKQGSINEKRTAVRKAKASNPRKIELVCLKNRFGVSGYRCLFDYYPSYDFFESDCTGIDEQLLESETYEQGKDKDGFISTSAFLGRMTIPFS